jgi:hypothetical protein
MDMLLPRLPATEQRQLLKVEIPKDDLHLQLDQLVQDMSTSSGVD